MDSVSLAQLCFRLFVFIFVCDSIPRICFASMLLFFVVAVVAVVVIVVVWVVCIHCVVIVRCDHTTRGPDCFRNQRRRSLSLSLSPPLPVTNK